MGEFEKWKIERIDEEDYKIIDCWNNIVIPVCSKEEAEQIVR